MVHVHILFKVYNTFYVQVFLFNALEGLSDFVKIKRQTDMTLIFLFTFTGSPVLKVQYMGVWMM